MKDDVSSFTINPLRNHFWLNCHLPKVNAGLQIGDNQSDSDLSALTHSECFIKYTEMFLFQGSLRRPVNFRCITKEMMYRKRLES